MSLEDEVDEELFNEKHLCFSNIIDIKTYSNIRKLLRVSSYVLRFIQRWRSTRKLNQRRKLHCKVESYIHLDEINKATLVWIKDIQKQTFHQELSAITIGRCLHVPTFVKQLKLYRDKNQVLIKLQGQYRLFISGWLSKIFCPATKKQRFTDLMMINIHKRSLRTGCSQTIRLIRLSFWIPCFRKVHSMPESSWTVISCKRHSAYYACYFQLLE